MKHVIMEMNEISLSKEVYDSRPHPFFAIFIYALLAMLIISLVWAYFGQIDIVVRAQGIIRPNAQMAQVINAVSGEVQEVLFTDGMHVAQGDVLYILQTFHLETEARTLEERLVILENELLALNLYRDSIEAGENLIGDVNDEHSARFDSFYVNLTAMEHIGLNQNQIFEESLADLEGSLSNVRFELDMLRTLEESMLNGEDLFGGYAQISVGRNREIFNTYRNRYLTYASDLANLEFQNQTISEALEGYTLVRDSIERGYSLFIEHSTYSGLYEEYRMQLELLQERYDLAETAYRRNTNLHESGIISQIDLQETEVARNMARFNLEDHMASFTLRINNSIRDTETRLTDSGNQRENFMLNSRVSVSNQIVQLESSVRELSQQVTQTILNQETVFLVGEELGNVAVNRLNEINRTLNQISAAEQELLILRSSHAQLKSQIEDSTVKAQIDGVINMHVELLEGSFLMTGINVLSIIPFREEMLTANIFISNNDIALIEEGMVVRYDIPAMPRRDFGEITGNITRISADVSANEGLLGYFLAESLLEDRVYYDTRGNGANLRVGMHFDSRISVNRQRILFYLLDQINFR